ncbi:FAD-dependent oxidoreductase [Nocardia alni]|uniref:FAD-dependent oxidoreductase n=1 Tax=Nocardia alni TaxID=2815723 RepID=UPI001C21BCB2|nr:NAD(P)/FAD-dependent oxidoreductase [Nocardia alni]
MVTILGGGIAGTVLAGALAGNQVPVTVYERQPEPGNGAFMVLDGHAHESLAQLGVPLEALHERSHTVPGFRFHFLPEERRATRSQGHRLYQRADLMAVLTEFASAANAPIHYDKDIIDLDPSTGALHASTGAIPSDGLVIAADGIDSIARRRLEPERPAEYAGQVVIYGTIPHAVQLDTEPDVMHFHGQLGEGPMPTSTFGHMWNDKAVFWFTRLTREPLPQQDIGSHPAAHWADAIRAADPMISGLIDTILAATDAVHVSNARNVPFDNARAVQLPIVLCGDADHAITPAAARGAREAIEDALALYRAITADESPFDAMTERRIRITEERTQQTRVISRATA